MDERRDSEPEPRVTRETTVINTGGRGGGGTGLLAAVLLIAVLAVIAFFVFGRGLGGDDLNVDIDVKAPDIDLPSAPPAAPAPSK